MGTMTTPELLAEMKKVCEAATTPPWERKGNCVYASCDIQCLHGIVRKGNRFSAWFQNDNKAAPEEEISANAAFTVAARTGWPRTIAALEYADRQLAGSPGARQEIQRFLNGEVDP